MPSYQPGEMIKYNKIKVAEFVDRPNRFIANVLVDGASCVAHVKNTGRCRELLVPGCTVILSESDNPARKTKYDLIAVYKVRRNKPPLLINMDSQIPNDVAEEWLKSGCLFSKSAVFKREVTFGKSRFDFYVEDGDLKAFVEVKGVTLENDGVAMFPDAPTERGIKHLNELAAAVSCGYGAYILFIIQMKDVNLFCPNDTTHKAFGDALRSAHKKGVKLLAIDCKVKEDSILADGPISISL